MGAYDVGHPTCLITGFIASSHSIIKDAEKVGLNVVQAISIVGQNDHLQGDIDHTVLLRLEHDLRRLVESRDLPKRLLEFRTMD